MGKESDIKTLVERLRESAAMMDGCLWGEEPGPHYVPDYLRLAADEIERLRAVLENIKKHASWEVGPADSHDALMAVVDLASSALTDSPPRHPETPPSALP